MNIQELKNAVALIESLSGDGRVRQQAEPQVEPQAATVGDRVIVRSSGAGVIYGEFVKNDGPTIWLKNARQLWKWKAKDGISLIDVATYGVDASGCKFSPASATVTVFGACVLIDTTPAASALIEAVK